MQWVWTYLTGTRGSRLIVNHYAPTIEEREKAGRPELVVAGPEPERADPVRTHV